MDLENCRQKREKNHFSPPLLSLLSARLHFFFSAAHSPPPLPFLGWPSSAKQPPAQHRAPASRAQPLTARPRPSARPPPLPAPSEPPGHVARPQPPPWRRGSALPRVPRLLFKRSRAPPRVSLSLPAPFSPRPGHNCRTEELRGPPSAVRVAVFPEPPSTPFFPAVSFALFPSLSQCNLFPISLGVDLVLGASASSRPPAMAPPPRPSPPAVFST